MNNNVSARTVKMVLLAILAAIMLILTFTPLGYLKIGIIEITFMPIPVAVGAIILGPLAGAIMGVVFGATSFIHALLGLSPFGSALMTINPFYTFILTMVPRILMGWLTGLIFQKLYQKQRTKAISYGAASLSAALLNTILFLSALVLLFGNTEYFKDFQGNLTGLLLLMGTIFVTNGLVEAIATMIIGGAISRALIRYRQ
ncbi:MAG: ECF transporter S component [Caldicoprobacterales bacterium]|nr:ECF transporter S component [Clostridiales bacterium]